jgi:hypothetical protein
MKSIFLFGLAASLGLSVACGAPAASGPRQADVSAAPQRAPASALPMIALVTRADWCSVCKANQARVSEVLGKGAAQKEYEIVMNDITSEETTARSKKVLVEKGLDELAAGAAPGTVVFVDAKTRKRIAEVTVAHQDEEIRMVTAMARKRTGS